VSWRDSLWNNVTGIIAAIHIDVGLDVLHIRIRWLNWQAIVLVCSAGHANLILVRLEGLFGHGSDSIHTGSASEGTIQVVLGSTRNVKRFEHVVAYSTSGQTAPVNFVDKRKNTKFAPDETLNWML
jgi:hypothetical protein